MAGYSNILEVSDTTTPIVEAACSGTHSVEVGVSFIGTTEGYSNILEVSGPTVPIGIASNILELESLAIPDGYPSNILEPTAFTTPTFGIDAIDQYVHGATSVLTVYGVDGTYTVRWSPSNTTPNAPGSVELTVETDSLDVSGNGTIDVVADRGIVRYLDTGYVWITQGTSFNFRGVTLALPAGREYVVLEAPLAASANRLTAIPDLDAGDMLIWWGATPSGDVSIETDASFNASTDVASFEVEVHVANLGYGTAVTQELRGEFEFSANHTATHAVGLTRTIVLPLAYTSTSEADSGRGLPAKNVEITGTHGLATTVATDASRIREFTSQSALGFSYQVTIETPFSVQIVEDFESTGTADFEIGGITKPSSFISNHAVAFSYSALDAVPTITTVQPMTHGIQSIIIGINFGN